MTGDVQLIAINLLRRGLGQIGFDMLMGSVQRDVGLMHYNDFVHNCNKTNKQTKKTKKDLVFMQPCECMFAEVGNDMTNIYILFTCVDPVK